MRATRWGMGAHAAIDAQMALSERHALRNELEETTRLTRETMNR
jgi:hypothetical protein